MAGMDFLVLSRMGLVTAEATSRAPPQSGARRAAYSGRVLCEAVRGENLAERRAQTVEEAGVYAGRDKDDEEFGRSHEARGGLAQRQLGSQA